MSRSLFEFEDQPWFPSVLRNYQTSFIGFLASKTGLYGAAPGLLATANPRHMVDLATGSGDAAVTATAYLRANGLELLLTDKYPNVEALEKHHQEAGVAYAPMSVDLRTDTLPPGDVYTLYNSFHHFTQKEQLQLIEKVHEARAQLFVFEPLRRDWLTFAKVAIATTLGPLLLTPFIRPFTWSRLLFTYLVPVGILVTFWDGAVSVLRALSHRDGLALQQAAKLRGIEIEYSRIKTKLAHITYFRMK